MGEAKRRRDKLGVQDERTSHDRKWALKEELWRIKRQRNGDALHDRLRCVIPWETWPSEMKRRW